MKQWKCMLILAFVLFLFMYDPRSKGLEKYIVFPEGGCAEGRYNNVQFGNDQYRCEMPTNGLGAIFTA